MDMGLLAVSMYQTRPKSKQKLQVISFDSNAAATAVEQPAAEFGPGITQERCLRSPNRCTNYMIEGFGFMNTKIHLRMNVTIHATLLHAMTTLVDQIAGNCSCGMVSAHLMGQLRGVQQSRPWNVCLALGQLCLVNTVSMQHV